MPGGGDEEAWMSVLALLVASVYFRYENGGAIWGDGNWRYYGCEQSWEYMGACGVDDVELKHLGLAIFLSVGYPRRLVIALRGTLCLNDLVADVKFVRELLHVSQRFQRTQGVILEVVDDFLRRGGAREDVYLAGHSLGAGIALLVGKHLVTARGIKPGTHLFNPPLLTAESIVTAKVFPWQTSGELTQWHKILGKVGDWMVTRFGNAKVMEEWGEFQRLHDWTPHLNFNSNDMICFQNIKFYKYRQHGQGMVANCISDLGILTRRFSGKYAKYIGSVVPSADLYISHRFRDDIICKYFNKKAHSLDQWLKLTKMDVVVQFEKVQARLLADHGHRHGALSTHHLLAPSYSYEYPGQCFHPRYGAGPPLGPQVAQPIYGGRPVVGNFGQAIRNAGHEVDRVVADIGYGVYKYAREMLRRC